MIELRAGASMAEYQRYIHELEAMHGWLQVDLIKNCFLLGEEVGELFKAVRRHERLFESGDAGGSEPAATPQATASVDASKAHVAEELVDVLNYLLAIANRLEVDLEAAFRAKNERNQRRVWK